MLLNLGAFSGIYLYRDVVDFRKSIDGLAAIVTEQMGNSTSNGATLKGANLFIFVGRRRDRMKILYFDRTGFALWYKRLERERFKIPRDLSMPVVAMTARELEWLLEGFDVWKMKPHEALHFNNSY